MSLTKPVKAEGSTIAPTIEGKTLRDAFTIEFSMMPFGANKMMMGTTTHMTLGEYWFNGTIITDVIALTESSGREGIPVSHSFTNNGNGDFSLEVNYELADTSEGDTLTDANCKLRVLCFQ